MLEDWSVTSSAIAVCRGQDRQKILYRMTESPMAVDALSTGIQKVINTPNIVCPRAADTERRLISVRDIVTETKVPLIPTRGGGVR